jgi:Uma2 family endonuclease
MATAPTLPFVPVDHYLNASYHPDKEYVEGVLVERSMPTPAHGALQLIVGEALRQHRKQFGYGVITGCRVQIVPRSRYRIPDVLVCNLPVPRTKSLESVPLAVIEIWSPDDRIGQQMARFREYWQLGVREIIVLDPDAFVALRYQDGALIEAPIDTLQLPGDLVVPFPVEDLLQELREELG